VWYTKALSQFPSAVKILICVSRHRAVWTEVYLTAPRLMRRPKKRSCSDLGARSHRRLHCFNQKHIATSVLVERSYFSLILLAYIAHAFCQCLHRPLPFIPDWFHGLSDHLMILFCSAAGFVCMVC